MQRGDQLLAAVLQRHQRLDAGGLDPVQQTLLPFADEAVQGAFLFTHELLCLANLVQSAPNAPFAQSHSADAVHQLHLGGRWIVQHLVHCMSAVRFLLALPADEHGTVTAQEGRDLARMLLARNGLSHLLHLVRYGLSGEFEEDFFREAHFGVTPGARHVVGVVADGRRGPEALVAERVVAGKDVGVVEKVQTDGAHQVLFLTQGRHVGNAISTTANCFKPLRLPEFRAARTLLHDFLSLANRSMVPQPCGQDPSAPPLPLCSSTVQLCHNTLCPSGAKIKA